MLMRGDARAKLPPPRGVPRGEGSGAPRPPDAEEVPRGVSCSRCASPSTAACRCRSFASSFSSCLLA